MSNSTRITQDVEILSGRRGPKPEHAVRFKDLEAVDLRAKAAAANLQRQINNSGISTIRDKIEAVRAFLYNTITYVDNEVSGARSDLQDLIDAQGVTLAEVQSTAGENAAALVVEAAARADADTALAGQIATISANVGVNTAAITAEQVARVNQDNAIAAQITTLSTNLGAANASITQAQNAISTLQGYAAATYTLRVKAGTAGAALELVAASNPVSGNQSALRLSADDILLDGTVLAEHINVVNLLASSAFIQNLEVDTLQIRGNAVTVPVSQTLTNSVSGSASFQEVQWLNHTMDVSGSIVVLWSGLHSYTAQPRGHEVEIRINGASVQLRGGDATNDYPTLAWSGTVGAGTRRISIYWRTPNGGINLANRNLSIIGVQR